jgi:hypothetical protein
MSLRQFSDNATTTLASGISSSATSLTCTSGGGSLFPAISGAQYFVCTLVKNGVPTTFEVIKVTGRSGDSFTSIVRAQEGTTALSWSAGDTVTMLMTSGDAAAFAQFDDLQTQPGNYAADVGSANAYSVTLSPALTAHVTGLPIRFVAAHSNTGSSTFNDGVGAVALLTQGGANLAAGNILANGIYEVMYTGSVFELQGTVPANFTQLAGSIANGQVPQSAVTQFTAAILASAALTGSPTAPTAATGNSSTAVATTAFVFPSTSLASNGSVKLGNGLLIQWGYAQGSGTSPAAVTVTFPTSFPNAILAAYCCTLRSTAGTSGSNFVSSLSNSGMVCVFDALDGQINVLNGGYWLAVGH